MDAALDVLGRVLDEAVEEGSGERGRMAVVAESMPDLPSWVEASAPSRTKRLFTAYLISRDSSEFPEQWVEHHNVFEDARDSPPLVDPWSAALEGPVPLAGGVVQASQDQQPASEPMWVGAPAAEVVDTVQSGERKIFIVHGHDEAARDSIRIYVHKQTGVMPISLAEEPGKGATIIEKFERVGGAASFVIVLLTPDDVGQTVAASELGNAPEARARQNVVLELGYFIGTIGRENIVVVDAGVERPSDLAGLSYVSYPGDNWKDDLRVELAEAQLLL